MVKGVSLFSLTTFSVGAHACTWGPEVGVRDHLWLHTCVHACGDLRLVSGIICGYIPVHMLVGP